MEIRNLDRAVPFVTKDGSEIRELLAYRNSAISQQSLAEARVAPGAVTACHRHLQTEEIYFILEGRGCMRIEAEECLVGPGDAIAILPGQRHQITNVGSEVLRFLCCCTPPYEHADTLLDDVCPRE
jgi:mannose-6-phosphate isomerase-like protein (cupin superfamily)